MQQGDLHTRRPQFTLAFRLVIKLYPCRSQICSIKDSTKGTYVWLFASLASSLYVNGEKSTLYKGLSFSGSAQWHLWDAAGFQPDTVSAAAAAAGTMQGGRRWNIYVNCCKTSHKRRQEECDEELSSGAVIMTSPKPTEEQKSKARARRAPVPDGARRRSEPL